MTPAKPAWKIELRATTYPVEEWVPLRRPVGGFYRFVGKAEADAAREKLLRVQPHLVIRVTSM